MEVSAHGSTDAAALEAVLAVVPVAGHDAPERLGARLEKCPARVVLEAAQRPSRSRVELAVEQDVADHAAFAGPSGERKETGARELRTRAIAVEATEQLVAAAHGEQRGSGADSVCQRGALGGEVAGDERLLSILAPAHVEEVDVRRHGIAEADAGDLEADGAPRAAALEHRDVPAIGVDVEIVGIQMPDHEAPERVHA